MHDSTPTRIENRRSVDEKSTVVEPKPMKRKKVSEPYNLVGTNLGETRSWTIPAGNRWSAWAAWNFLLSEFSDTEVGPSPDQWDSDEQEERRVAKSVREARPTLAFWKGEFFRYEPKINAYQPIPVEKMRAHVREFLRRGKSRDSKDRTKTTALPIGVAAVRDVVEAIKATPGIMLDDRHGTPHWRRWPGRDVPDAYPEPDTLIPFKDGWLQVDRSTGEYRFLSRYTKRQATVAMARDLFTTSALPYRFSDDFGEPVEWLKFLESVWASPDAPEAQALGEFMGLSMTTDMSMQKILLLVGPKRSGKGTISRVWRSMLGEQNVAAPTASTLTERFGLWGLVDRQLAMISDARFQHGRDSSIVTERLLSISGDDALLIDRKNLPPLVNHKLKTRLVLMSNENPRLTDSAQALPSRFIVLPMTRSFFEKEDRSLEDKLDAEIPGIIRWALQGLQRLYARGHFVQPKSGERILEAMTEHSSDVGLFVSERCERPQGSQGVLAYRGSVPPMWQVRPDVLYSAYREWSEDEEGRKPRSKSDFLSQVSALEGIKYERVYLNGSDGPRPRMVTGLRMRDPEYPGRRAGGFA